MSRLGSQGAAVMVAAALSTFVASAWAAAPSSAEWPEWRGPNRDGICTETGLLQRWPQEGPPLEWRINGLGGGYSSVSIAAGKIFTQGERNRRCELIALDLQNGKELWSAPSGKGNPNGTPTVDGDLVFAVGRDGELTCAQIDTGQVVWQKSFARDFGGRMMSHWGYSESPLVDGDRLLCTPGGQDAMIVALDKKTGSVIWKAEGPGSPGPRGKDGAGYSSIVVSEAAGVRQYVQLTGRGLFSVAADDGRFLWDYNRVANGTANIPTPIVRGDYVFASSGYSTGAALMHIVPRPGGQVKAREVYFLTARQMQNHHGGMVLFGDHVYCGHGHNMGIPQCIQIETGKVRWRAARGQGRGSAAVLLADGHLYFRYENGVMALIKATPDKYELKGTFELASNNGKSWPHPVICDRKLYIRDQGTLLCYNLARN